MLAYLTETGSLVIRATDETEKYAMKKWFEDWHKGLVSIQLHDSDIPPVSKGNLQTSISGSSKA